MAENDTWPFPFYILLRSTGPAEDGPNLLQCMLGSPLLQFKDAMLPAGNWLHASSACCIANGSPLPGAVLAFGFFCVRTTSEMGLVKGW